MKSLGALFEAGGDEGQWTAAREKKVGVYPNVRETVMQRASRLAQRPMFLRLISCSRCLWRVFFASSFAIMEVSQA